MVNRKQWMMLLLLLPQWLWGQQLSKLNLDQAYELAQKNYPAIKQKDLVRQSADLNIENLSKGYLPQVSLNGQASYQSDVTSIKGSIIPGVNIQAPPKDQYKFTADLNQVIYDGGSISQQKALAHLTADVETQKVEVELYNLKERINQIYLGILFLDEQYRQAELVKQDLQVGIKTVEAQVNNGVAFRSNLQLLKAELLRNDQREIEIKSSRKGYVETLALFLNQPLSEKIQLEQPFNVVALPQQEVTRPELKMYDSQIMLYEQQSKLINSRNLPKASLFVQGGYGRPGLNMLDNAFDFFYMGGVRLNWSLSGLYTQKREKELVKVNQQMVNVQKETFLLNTNTQLKQQQSEIDKMEKLVATDKEIIELRLSVKQAAKAQLDNGVITANDYLREVNAEDQARQSMIMHQLQLLQAKINYQTISGKQ